MTHIDLKDMFAALANVTSAERVISGRDPWRGDTGEDRLQHIDPELAQETKAPLTKPTGNRDSVWFAMHFKVMMPSLARALHQLSHDEEALATKLDAKETNRLVPYWQDIRQHVADFSDLEFVVKDVLNNLPPQPDDLPRAFKQSLALLPLQSHTFDTFSALLEHAEENGLQPLHAALAEQKERGANIDYIRIGEALLSTLPDNPAELEPPLANLLQRQKQQLENGANDFWGRLIQTYYAEHQQKYAEYGYHPKAQNFHEIPDKEGAAARSIHQRTKAYFLGPEGLPNFPPELKEGTGAPEALSIAQVATFFSKFLRKPAVVELVHPSFNGAATQAAESVVELVDRLAEKTEGRADYRTVEINTHLLPENHDLLRRVGRLAMVMDIVGNGHLREHDYGRMDGESLRRVARAVWPEDARKDAWGGENRYRLSASTHGFGRYRQDTATVLYAAAVNISDHAALLGDNATTLSEAGKKLGHQALEAADADALRQIMHQANRLTGHMADALATIDQHYAKKGESGKSAQSFGAALGPLFRNPAIALG